MGSKGTTGDRAPPGASQSTATSLATTRSATRLLSFLLALAVAALPVSARAQDAGTPAPPAASAAAPAQAAPPPGRATEVAPCEEPGPPDAPAQPCPGAGWDSQGRALTRAPGLPYRGSLLDRQRVGTILAKRLAAESERDALRLEVQDARARQGQAEQERDAARAGQGPSWGTLIGVTGAALVLGIVGGVVATLAIQDRAR
jgi:hypothetical protein